MQWVRSIHLQEIVSRSVMYFRVSEAMLRGPCLLKRQRTSREPNPPDIPVVRVSELDGRAPLFKEEVKTGV